MKRDNLNINVANKPNESTPRLVKDIFLIACLQYGLGGLLLLLLSAVWGFGLLLLLTGLLTHIVVMPVVHWYLTG